jgi:phospholipid transport system substrate-binding protein
MRNFSGGALAALLAFAPAAVHAEVSDPAATQVDKLNDALLGVMKDGSRLGSKGRYQRLEAMFHQVFDLTSMTRFAVGPTWSTLSPADQASLVKAFSRMTVANFAHNFDDYSGQRFVIDKVETRGPDKLVATRLLSPNGKTENLTYRMRQAGGAWKIIDVYYRGAVSSLLGQRSEYASTLKTGGANALVKKLNTRADELLGT